MLLFKTRFRKSGVNMNTKAYAIVFLICISALLLPSLVEAKPSIDLDFAKDNGYGFGNDIGGLWTVSAHVSSEVAYVEFYLDGQLQRNDTSAPYSWQFDTVDYSVGSHAIKAVAYDALGETAFLQVERNFQETSTETLTTIIFAIVIAVVAVAVGIAFYRVKTRK